MLLPLATAAVAACLPGAGTNAVAADHGSSSTFHLAAVSVAHAGCADRVTFRFAKGTASYRVEYEPAARAKTQDASGRRLRIAGRAFLVVRFTATTTDGGPSRISGGGASHVREAVRTGAFEGVVTWAIGLDAKRPFRVRTSGSQLVVSVG